MESFSNTYCQAQNRPTDPYKAAIAFYGSKDIYSAIRRDDDITGRGFVILYRIVTCTKDFWGGLFVGEGKKGPKMDRYGIKKNIDLHDFPRKNNFVFKI
jgi:hypothetical protein